MSPTNHFDDGLDKPWTLAQIYEDLGGRLDIARALNVNIRRVTDWQTEQEKYGSPQPLRIIGNVKIYSIQEWRDWYRRWLEKRGTHNKVAEAKPHGHGESFWAHFMKEERRR